MEKEKQTLKNIGEREKSKTRVEKIELCKREAYEELK